MINSSTPAYNFSPLRLSRNGEKYVYKVVGEPVSSANGNNVLGNDIAVDPADPVMLSVAKYLFLTRF